MFDECRSSLSESFVLIQKYFIGIVSIWITFIAGSTLSFGVRYKHQTTQWIFSEQNNCKNTFMPYKLKLFLKSKGIVLNADVNFIQLLE